MQKLRAAQKLALAVTLGSCAAPKNEIATKPPLVEVPADSIAVAPVSSSTPDTPTIIKMHHKNCIQASSVLNVLVPKCRFYGLDGLSAEVFYPVESFSFLVGQFRRPNDVVLSMDVGSSQFKGKVQIWVGEVIDSGAEFRYKFSIWNRKDQFPKDADWASIRKFIDERTCAEGAIFVEFNGKRPDGADLLEALQPGKMSVKRGPPGSVVLKYDAVVSCK